MTNYEELQNAADADGYDVREKPLRAHDGLIKGHRIAIRQDLPTTVQKACVLAEEIGHYRTTAGNILDQSDASNSRQEQRGRTYAYKLLCPLEKVIEGYQKGIRSRFEMADYLSVSESFLDDALQYYCQKYGKMVRMGNCIICFDPFGVIKFFV